MSIVANVRVNTAVPFPSLVTGSGPVAIQKQNGVWTVSLNYAAVADAVPPSGDWPHDEILYWNNQTGAFSTISLTELLNLVKTNPAIVNATAGPFNVGVSDTVFVLNKAAPSATVINLPAAAARNPNGLPLEIYDFAGNAGPITINPSGADQIMGANSAWTLRSGGVAQSGGAIKLTPVNALNGWLVK